ncbi:MULTISPECIES: hypothetical protein [unclassified Bradyrhizobium]|uniref:hypothetical protein n=1 Tax=unclassified Bradyrhizobium TaxID=2631580 RepID=UPI0028EA9B0F|nr:MULTISPECIES: hypothetical protein [unclassified Bradyrhizobium]
MSDQRNGMDEWQDATNARMAAGNEPDSMAALQAEIASLKANLEQSVEHGAKGWAEVASLRAQLASISRELADAKSNVTYLSNAAETAFRDRNYYSAQLASARKAAIEECVKIAERFAGANAVSEPYTSYIQGRAEGAQAVAAHIRAAALTDKEGTS